MLDIDDVDNPSLFCCCLKLRLLLTSLLLLCFALLLSLLDCDKTDVDEDDVDVPLAKEAGPKRDSIWYVYIVFI